MSKIHKLHLLKTACGLTYKWKTKRGRDWYNWVVNAGIETDQSGAKVDCKKCLRTLKKE